MHGGCDVTRVIQQLREYTMLRVSVTKPKKEDVTSHPRLQDGVLAKALCVHMLPACPVVENTFQHWSKGALHLAQGLGKEGISRISSGRRFCGETYNETVFHIHTCVWLSRAKNVNAQMRM